MTSACPGACAGWSVRFRSLRVFFGADPQPLRPSRGLDGDEAARPLLRDGARRGPLPGRPRARSAAADPDADDHYADDHYADDLYADRNDDLSPGPGAAGAERDDDGRADTDSSASRRGHEHRPTSASGADGSFRVATPSATAEFHGPGIDGLDLERLELDRLDLAGGDQ